MLIDEETGVPLLEPEAEDFELEQMGGKADVRSGGYRNDDAPSRSYQRRTPLPLGQLVILCAVRLSEPISYTQIFPYINQMMADLKVTDKPSEIGYYSGIVDSVFAVCQLFTIFQWGKLSDRIGRKPVILFGLLGVAISSSLFGLSDSLFWAVISRSLAGALSGNSAVVQSVVGEITDESNQGAAFPLTGLSWSLGCIIGPMIGGNFVKPIQSWPTTFGTLPIFQTYPYLLPCIISSSITLVSIAFGLVFLKESLPSKLRLSSSLPSPIVSSRLSEKLTPSRSAKRQDISIREILASPIIKTIFQNYFLLSTLMTAFDVVFILLAYTPVQLGGLSRSPEEIGYALAFSGIAGAIMQILVFPTLQRRLDNIPLYRLLMSLWPIVYAFLPILSFLAQWTAPPIEMMQRVDEVTGEVEFITGFEASWALWLAIVIVLALLRSAAMSFSLNVILIKNAAPSKEALGSTFGLAQSVACIARAGAPAFVSTLFAISKKYHLMGGNLVWAVMFVVSLLGLWSTYHVRDGAVERSYKRLRGEEEVGVGEFS